MKRILSLLLALSMMVSLLPAVSAEETEAEYTSPGITLSYDLSGAIERFKKDGATFSGEASFFGNGYNAFSYEATGGFFEYAANKSKDLYSWNSDGYNYPVKIGSRTISEIKATGISGASGIQLLSYYLESEGPFNNWFAVKINVPKKGVYTPKASYWRYKKTGETYLDYYLIKDTGEDIKVALDETYLSTDSEYYIGSKSCEDLNAAGSQTIVYNEAFDKALNLDEGEYYLVYKPRVVKPAPDWIGNYAMVGNFTLDGGTGGKAIPMIAAIECDSVRVFDGGNTAQLSTKLLMSDKSEKTAADVKYKALTPDFATVDENTGLITGVKPGTAEFEATATENGKEYKATFSIPVSDSRLSGITVKYNLGAFLKTNKATVESNGYKTISSDSTNGFYEFAAAKYGGFYSWNEASQALKPFGDMTVDSYGYGMKMYAKTDAFFAIKIYVPEKGVYTPKASYCQFGNRPETYIDYFLIKITDKPISEVLAYNGLTTSHSGYIGSKRSDSGTSSNKLVNNEAFADSVNLDAGEYYLVYKSRYADSTKNTGYVTAGDFTLDGGNIKDPAPMMARFSADKDTIYSNGGTAKVYAMVYLSDGTTKRVDDVTVTSLTDYAEINNIFGVIIGRAFGTAKFRVEVNYGGKSFSDELEVEVSENPMQPGEGEVVYYDISSWLDSYTENDSNGAGGFGGLGYKAMTYLSTGDVFEYAANKTNGKYSWQEGGIDYTTYPDSSKARIRIAKGSKYSGLQMYVTDNGWWALKIKVPKSSVYMPAATYWGYNRGGESYLDYFLIKNDGREMSVLLADANLTTKSAGYLGSKRNENTTVSGSQGYFFDEPLGNVVYLDEGEYYLVYKPRSVGGKDTYALASNFSLDGVNCIKSLFVDVDTELNWNDEAQINILPTRLDGTVLDENDLDITYTSSNTNILTVDNSGVVKAVGDGAATVTVTVSDGTNSISEKVVFNVYDNTGVSDFLLNAEEKVYVSQKTLLDVDAIMNSGNILDVPEADITYTAEPEEILTVAKGILTAHAEGKATLTTKISYRGTEKEYVTEITVIPQTGKTEPTIYTYAERQNALNNAKKYDWAAKSVKGYIRTGDRAIEVAEAMIPQIYGEGLPRGRQIGCTGDDYYNLCRYCHANIEGENSWKFDYVNRPWKVQCSACKRLFPSNNFEGFLKLGLDESGLYFDVDRARQAHHEMLFHPDGETCACEKPKVANTPEWYIFYGYGNPKGYLYNELYKEIRDSNTDPWGDKITWNDKNGGANLGTYKDPETGKVLWQGGDMWGVDDGWGYLPGRIYADGLTERHGWIALYFYNMWMSMFSVAENLNNAYVYTSDPKYGRVGIYLLDRVADVWDSFDMYYFRDKFLNTHGGSGYGAATGRINDYELGRRFNPAADAFYPMIYDEEVIRTLSEDAEKRGLENPKTSSELIWRNIADGLLIAMANMCKDGRINGNYGQAQCVAAYAAIALNEQPKTDEIISWIYKSGGGNHREVTGGNFEAKIINDVDRDGMGNEGAPGYNTSWVKTLRMFADVLAEYEGEKDYNPYENPKFVKMFDPQMNILLAHSKDPNIGDTGSAAATATSGGAIIWYSAFKKVTNEEYKRKIAQHLWYVTNGNLAQFGNDLLSENPESAEEELMQYVDVNARIGSQMLGGYGLALLRDGNNYKSSNAATAKNTHRDFWMWFGRTSAAHSHQDALNIGIDAFGLDVAPDLGYPDNTSYIPSRLQWVNTTLSHNTVVVDEKGQGAVKGIHGYPYHFDDSGKVKLMDADTKSVYPQTENYRRTVVMVQANDDVAYGVDFFRVTGGSHHLFSFHSQAENAYPVEGLDLTKQVDENGNYMGTYVGDDGKDPETGEWTEYGQDPYTQNAWSYPTKYPRGYTWLKNVRRDKQPEDQFTVEFDVKDYRKVLKNGNGIKLRMTQFNNFTPTEVAIAAGYMTNRQDTQMMPRTLDYVLVERDGKGEELDSLFTTVYEPYRNTPYIEELKPIDIKVKTGDEAEGDMARAVKVKHTKANGGNTDYIVYATNKNVVYTVIDGDFSFDFSGFVGVYTINANGAMIYRYLNDGTIIGEETGNVSAYTGTVTGFQKGNEFENYIDVEIDCTDLNDLAGKYIFVDNDGVRNAAYEIISATDSAEGLKPGSVRLDIGTVGLIRGHVDQNDLDKGYVYNIKEGQTFSVPTAFVDESVPEFDEVSDNLSVSAGSSISVNIHAKTPVIGDGAPTITYIGATLPRGASINSETGVFTWKPDPSQVGDNHVAVTARDSDGREATIHFDIAVYGSTTGSKNEVTETPDTPPAGGGGGGGGGGATPTDKPGDTTNTDENASSDEKDTSDDSDQSNVGEGVPALPQGQFTDLTNHAWAADAITTLADDGIIRGTTSDTYSPANNITRADFALLLVRAFKFESDNVENFADVSASDYFASELAIARNNGIISGIGDNKFAPRNTITRQDMMVIVYRAMQKLNVGFGIYDEPQYDDYDTVAEYACDAVSALISAGLVNGKSGRIAPTDYTTRAEVAVLIKRILDYIK